MAEITLHKIFQVLVNDNNFLTNIIEIENKKEDNKKNTINLISNIVTEYMPLVPYDTQEYSFFPTKIKKLLSPNYIRFGIKNITEKNLNIVNISFLNSLNILLRPDMYKANIDVQLKNITLLENFIVHKFQRNYNIDKIKNTKKVKLINEDMIKRLTEGKISHDIIQKIVNIFEINLLILDFNKSEFQFYWTCGIKYPYLNLFKDVYCMSFIQGNYEPIFIPDNKNKEIEMQNIYIFILSKIKHIKTIEPVSLFVTSLDLINSWQLDNKTYVKIFKKFFMEKYKDNIKSNTK